MKKKYFTILCLISSTLFFTSCNSEESAETTTTEAQADTTKSTKDFFIKQFSLEALDFEKLFEEDVPKLVEYDKIVDSLIRNYNNTNPKKNKIKLNQKSFQIPYDKLKKFIDSTPDLGYIFFEFGLSNRGKNAENGTDFKDQIIKLSKLNSGHTQFGNAILEFGGKFDNDSKKNLREAYDLLYNYAPSYSHFSTQNLAGVIFRKDSCLKWLTKNNIDTTKQITLSQKSEISKKGVGKTTLLVQATDTNNKEVSGNRGSQCCPPQE